MTSSVRRAVVTGAAGGLGSALCEALSRRGFEVWATDRSGAPHHLDVTDARACEELAQTVRPDLWINNAGVLGAGSAIDQPLHDVQLVLQVNLLGAIHGARAAAQVMRERRSGHILNVGSFASWFAPLGQAVYAASKHGLRAYTLSLAAELQGTGVDVSLLCPDGIRTPMLKGKERDPHAAMSFSAGDLLEPEQVVHAALELVKAPRLVSFVPPLRGVGARVLGSLPSANVLATRFLAAQGQRAQTRLRKVSAAK